MGIRKRKEKDTRAAVETAPQAARALEYLVATDGSPASDLAVDFAIARASEAGARLLIVRAVEGTLASARSADGVGAGDLAVDVESDAKIGLLVDVRKAKEAGLEATSHLVKLFPPNDVAVAVVKFAEERRVDQIFVGSHGRTGLMRQMLGSVADKVVKLAHCHVTVVR